VFDGGTCSFTLNVSETGCLPRTVTVTLNVATNHTGAAVFKLLERDAQGVEYLERLDTGAGALTNFVDAFTWVETNAQANTEYTIRVEKNETGLPHLLIGLNNAENVSLRLKGTTEGPRILEANEVTNGAVLSPLVNISNLSDGGCFIQIGSYYNTSSRKTFILGKNITIRSGNIYGIYGAYSVVIDVGYNATLVLESGSSIRDHSFTSSQAIIRIEGSKTDKEDQTQQGKLSILGGSITNCTIASGKGLIYFTRAASNVADGAFYLAPNSGFVLSGNYAGVVEADKVAFSTTLYSFASYLNSGVSMPPIP
jgi:hypothetical protein